MAVRAPSLCVGPKRGLAEIACVIPWPHICRLLVGMTQVGCRKEATKHDQDSGAGIDQIYWSHWDAERPSMEAMQHDVVEGARQCNREHRGYARDGIEDGGDPPD